MMTRLKNLIGIGRVTTVDDSGELQTMQVTEGAAGSGFIDRVLDKVRRVSEFGFASVPPIGSEIVMLRRGGDRSCSLVVATSHRPSRPREMQPGDAALYDVRGAIIKLTADGIVIEAAGQPVMIGGASKVTIDAPEVELTGALRVAQEITALTGGSPVAVGAMRDAYNAHRHTGVSAGSATSGATDHAA